MLGTFLPQKGGFPVSNPLGCCPPVKASTGPGSVETTGPGPLSGHSHRAAALRGPWLLNVPGQGRCRPRGEAAVLWGGSRGRDGCSEAASIKEGAQTAREGLRTCAVLTLLPWPAVPPQAHTLCSRGVKAFVVSEAPGPAGDFVFLRRPASPAESKPSANTPPPLSPAEPPLPVGPPAVGTARPPCGPGQLPLSPPCLSGLLSLHSACHRDAESILDGLSSGKAQAVWPFKKAPCPG